MVNAVCGICGGSGAGKTTLTSHLVDLLPADQVSVIAYDAYYLDQSDLSLEQRKLVNYDHPASLDNKLFADHLSQLRAGYNVEVPVYDFSTHARTDAVTVVEARPYIVAEGILILADDEIRARLDVAAFIDVAQDVRLARRIDRDVAERGRDADDVRRQFATWVAPMHDEFVQPHSRHADVVMTLGQDYAYVAARLAALLRNLSAMAS